MIVKLNVKSLDVVSVNHTEFSVKILDKKNNVLIPENKDYPITKVKNEDVEFVWEW